MRSVSAAPNSSHRSCSTRGLTQCSPGHLAAAHAWPSFHSGPSAVCRKAPVNANVRPRRNAKPERVHCIGAGRSRVASLSSPFTGKDDSTRSASRPRSQRLHAGQEQAAPATTSKSTKISTQRYSRRQRQHAKHRKPVCGSRFARQCCAWQSEGCGPWRTRLRWQWRQRWCSDDSTADMELWALQCAHVQRHEIQVIERAAREA